MEEVVTLLNNCEYFTLVEPFQFHGLQGNTLDGVESFNELTELDGRIRSLVAKAFFKQLMEWKNDGVPRAKLEASIKVLSSFS